MIPVDQVISSHLHGCTVVKVPITWTLSCSSSLTSFADVGFEQTSRTHPFYNHGQ